MKVYNPGAAIFLHSASFLTFYFNFLPLSVLSILPVMECIEFVIFLLRPVSKTSSNYMILCALKQQNNSRNSSSLLLRIRDNSH